MKKRWLQPILTIYFINLKFARTSHTTERYYPIYREYFRGWQFHCFTIWLINSLYATRYLNPTIIMVKMIIIPPFLGLSIFINESCQVYWHAVYIYSYCCYSRLLVKCVINKLFTDLMLISYFQCGFVCQSYSDESSSF